MSRQRRSVGSINSTCMVVSTRDTVSSSSCLLDPQLETTRNEGLPTRGRRPPVAYGTPSQYLHFGDTSLNVILFVPLCLAICLLGRSPATARVLMAVLALPLAIESHPIAAADARTGVPEPGCRRQPPRACHRSGAGGAAVSRSSRPDQEVQRSGRPGDIRLTRSAPSLRRPPASKPAMRRRGLGATGTPQFDQLP